MAEFKKSEKNGANRCPHCGATDVKLNTKTGKLKCNYCRTEFTQKKVNAYGGVKDLKGETVGDGAAPIIPDEKVIVTLKCPACGAEVVINTDEAVSARCHWCRNTLSLNEKMKNGAVPDLVLPFSYEKGNAEEKIREFVHKRRFFAHPTFKREFKPENVMGVYLPYMIVDINAHADMKGEAEHLIRTYTSGGKNKTRYYDAEAYSVTRDFDLYVDDLTIEASSDKIQQDTQKNTNNIINAIMPFDTDNCEDWTPNYLHGYASERRDTNVADLREQLGLQVGDIARYKVKESMTYYNRGARWSSENVNIKGTRWKSAYLPVWLYSYLQQTDKGNMLHYVAVNGRTGETMGSVPINKTRLRLVSAILEIIGIFLGSWWIKFWLGVPMDADDDNPALFGLIGLTPGFIFYWIQTARYRNMNARHKYEAETKADVDNLKKTDTFLQRRNRLRNARISGENDSVVKGVLAKNNKVLMGEKMANWLGIGRMAGSKPNENPVKGNQTDVAVGTVKKGVKIVRTILLIWVITIFLTAIAFVIALAVSKNKNDYDSPSYSSISKEVSNWAKENDYSFRSGSASIPNLCMLRKKGSDKFDCYSILSGYSKFEMTKEYIYSKDDMRDLRSLEFPLDEENSLHKIFVNNNVKYRNTVVDGTFRYIFYMSGKYTSESNTYCTIREQIRPTDKNRAGEYRYGMHVVCAEIDRSTKENADSSDSSSSSSNGFNFNFDFDDDDDDSGSEV